jgi:UDP-N-acetylglucosamine 2-epimerase
MAEAFAAAHARAATESTVLERLNLREHRFVLATVHRAENTDDGRRLAAIVRGLESAAEPVVLPVHPRTRRALDAVAIAADSPIRLVDPVGYIDMVRLLGAARLVATDSGGLQKEAYWAGTPCITMRDETEWVETVASGWNTLVGADAGRIADALSSVHSAGPRAAEPANPPPSQRIVELLGAC